MPARRNFGELDLLQPDWLRDTLAKYSAACGGELEFLTAAAAAPAPTTDADPALFESGVAVRVRGVPIGVVRLRGGLPASGPAGSWRPVLSAAGLVDAGTVQRWIQLAVHALELAAEAALAGRERSGVTDILFSLSARLTVEQILCRILDGIALSIPFDYANVTLVDWETEELHVLAHKIGTNPAAPGKSAYSPTRWSIRQGITGWVVTHQRSVRSPDVRRDKRYFETSPSTVSELAVPLLRQGSVVGALNLEADAPDHFRGYDESLLDLIAATIATAVAQARDHAGLLDKERGWSDRFDALTQLHRTILESPDEATLLQELAARTVRLFPAFEMCGIRLLDPEKGKLLLMGLGHRRQPPSFEAVGPLIPVVGSISGRAVLDGRSVNAPDLENQQEFFNRQLATAYNLRDMVAVPIPRLGSREALGCINVYTTKSTKYRFQDQDVRLLEQIASFVAIALANLRTALELSAHRETSLHCRHAATSRQTLDGVAALARSMTRARGSSIFLRDGDLLRLKGTTGVDAADRSAVTYELGKGKTGWVGKYGRPIRLIDRTDSHEIDSYPGLVEMHKFAELLHSPCGRLHLSFLAVPIEANGQVVGVVRAAGREGDLPFTRLDQTILEAIAHQLAVAISASIEHDHFMGSMAHELEKPITAISAACNELMALPPGERMGGVDQLQTIATYCKLTSRLIESFADVQSLLQDPSVKIETKPVALPRLLFHIVALYTGYARAKSIEISVNAAGLEGLPEVEGDATLIAQIFMNLLDNAIKYGAPGSGIEVGRYGFDAASCTISVRNLGTPIPPDALERLFEAGYRTQDARDLVPAGMGIGLTVSRNIARRHGGDLWVECSAGQRAAAPADVRFYVRLPIARPS